MSRRPRTRTVPIGQTVQGAGHEVVPAPAHGAIVVTSYLCVLGAGGTYQWKSGSTAISDAVPVDANSGAAASSNRDDGVLNCLYGEPLVIDTTGAPAKGHVTYHIE